MATTHDSGTSGEPLGGGSPVSDGSFLLGDSGETGKMIVTRADKEAHEGQLSVINCPVKVNYTSPLQAEP